MQQYNNNQFIMNTLNTPIKQIKHRNPGSDSPKSETSTCCFSESDRQNFQKYFGFENHQKIIYDKSETNNQKVSNNVKLKNQLCRNYMQMGYCPYNQKCQFAHGCEQLRQKTDQNNRYKTKKCNAFFTNGYCMYGERCNFMHKTQIKNSQQKWKIIRKNYRGLLDEIQPLSRLFPHAIQQN